MKKLKVEMIIYDDGKPPTIALPLPLFEEIEHQMHPISRFCAEILASNGILNLACFIHPDGLCPEDVDIVEYLEGINAQVKTWECVSNED